ncbi:MULTISPECIES: hypothetical protein [Clostridium]|uniref:Uncharacterized protein n=1 Tax=Clostridium lapidicellarium TaxID=3240931 RepID=A0ABV4DZB0_9CLOT
MYFAKTFGCVRTKYLN